MIDIVCNIFMALMVFIAAAVVATIFIMMGLVAVSAIFRALLHFCEDDDDEKE